MATLWKHGILMATHDELVRSALIWLRGPIGAKYAIRDAGASGEICDVWGWQAFKKLRAMPNGSLSIVVECKATRSDFLADTKKSFRRLPEKGAGVIRWYYAKPGIIDPNELPEGWGLVEPRGNVHRYLVKPSYIAQNEVGRAKDFRILERITDQYQSNNMQLRSQLHHHDIEPANTVYGLNGRSEIRVGV